MTDTMYNGSMNNNEQQKDVCPVCGKPVSIPHPEGAKVYHFLCAKLIFDVDNGK